MKQTLTDIYFSLRFQRYQTVRESAIKDIFDKILYPWSSELAWNAFVI